MPQEGPTPHKRVITIAFIWTTAFCIATGCEYGCLHYKCCFHDHQYCSICHKCCCLHRKCRFPHHQYCHLHHTYCRPITNIVVFITIAVILIKSAVLFITSSRGSASEYVLYFKCHRIYYNGGVTEYTNLYIFCDTCLLWDVLYDIFKSVYSETLGLEVYSYSYSY